MAKTQGYRKRTRYQFSKGFKNKGIVAPSKHLIQYKIGDYVDIVVDGSQHKGMPWRYYHGKTAQVFDVNPRSLGVSLLRPVRHRKILKKLHVRLEHVNKSLCRQDFLNRVKANDKAKSEAKKQNKIISTKRQPKGPLKGGFAKGTVDFQNPKVVSEVF